MSQNFFEVEQVPDSDKWVLLHRPRNSIVTAVYLGVSESKPIADERARIMNSCLSFWLKDPRVKLDALDEIYAPNCYRAGNVTIRRSGDYEVLLGTGGGVRIVSSEPSPENAERVADAWRKYVAAIRAEERSEVPHE